MFDDDLERELLFGKNGTDLFSLDLSPAPITRTNTNTTTITTTTISSAMPSAKLSILAFSPEIIQAGDNVLVCVGFPKVFFLSPLPLYSRYSN